MDVLTACAIVLVAVANRAGRAEGRAAAPPEPEKPAQAGGNAGGNAAPPATAEAPS